MTDELSLQKKKEKKNPQQSKVSYLCMQKQLYNAKKCPLSVYKRSTTHPNITGNMERKIFPTL